MRPGVLFGLADKCVLEDGEALLLKPEDQGKRCAYAACWQTKSGLMGPWTDIVTVLVP
jgi:hypothetical protein